MVRKLVQGFKTKGLLAGDCVCLHAYNDVSGPASTCIYLHLPASTWIYLVDEKARGEGGVTHLTHGCLATQISYPLLWLAAIGAGGCGEGEWSTFGQDETKARDSIALLGATSGTTGLPKAAALSHQYVVAQAATIKENEGERPYQVRVDWSPEGPTSLTPI